MEREISAFLHCAKCIKEKPPGISPQDYARLSVGWTKLGFQVWCNRHDENVAHMDFLGQKISYAQKYDKEEIRLNYCKKCGCDLDHHDRFYCVMNDYPAVYREHGDLITIAKQYKIDLTEANEKIADGGRHGAEEGDIYLEICGLIKDYRELTDPEIKLKKYMTQRLKDWGYEDAEIEKAFIQIPRLP